jgi:selenoprotein W-related protein
MQPLLVVTMAHTLVLLFVTVVVVTSNYSQSTRHSITFLSSSAAEAGATGTGTGTKYNPMFCSALKSILRLTTPLRRLQQRQHHHNLVLHSTSSWKQSRDTPVWNIPQQQHTSRLQQQQQQYLVTLKSPYKLLIIKNKQLHWKTVLQLSTTTSTNDNNHPTDHKHSSSIPSSTDTPVPIPTTITSLQIVIEYCTGCKWNLRAFWMAQELLLQCRNYVVDTTTLLDNNNDTIWNNDTNDESSSLSSLHTDAQRTGLIRAVTLIPSSVAGTFRITMSQCQNINTTTITPQNNPTHCITTNQTGDHNNNDGTLPSTSTVLWDRTIDAGFPELEELQQRIMDSLVTISTIQHLQIPSSTPSEMTPMMIIPQPSISIQYSTGCEVEGLKSGARQTAMTTTTATTGSGTNYVLRASYIAQEILSTFSTEIKAISLIPIDHNTSHPQDADHDDDDTTSLFTVRLNDTELIYTYPYQADSDMTQTSSSIPQKWIATKELKQRIRDYINPTKNLGHSDVVMIVASNTTTTTTTTEHTSVNTHDQTDESIVMSTAVIVPTTNTTASKNDNDNDDDDDDDDSDYLEDGDAAKARKFFGVA